MFQRVGILLLAVLASACSPPAPSAGQPDSGFPKIKDINTLSIRLTRTACFGPCPMYGVELKGDGSVNYCGVKFVAEKGPRARKISKETVLTLVDQIKAARFFELKDEYVAPITDNPAYQVVVSYDGHSKRVVDYVGEQVGMPPSLTAIEDAIDAAAETGEWVGPPPDGFGASASDPYPECFKLFDLPVRPG